MLNDSDATSTMTASNHSSLAYFSQCRPAKKQGSGIEEDEEIDDIGELPADFDFTRFEDMLTEVNEPHESERSEEGRGAGAHMPQ